MNVCEFESSQPRHVSGRLELELAERLKRDGVEPVGGTPDAFGALIAKEIAQWRDLGRSAKITLD
jgi:tripartite-type tricarboxylate transporter receptor subunit TctC